MASARCVLTLLLCSSALVAVVNACGFQYPAFLQSDEPILGSAVDDEDTDFNAHQTLAHLNNQGVLTSGSSRGTWSCVDGRGDEPQLGTPGGDMGEFIIGLLAYEALTYKELSESDVCSIFNDFVNSRYVSKKRPFYFHNDETRLRDMFAALEEEYPGIKASILPDVYPEKGDIWLDYLVKPEYNGCGHIRLMLEGLKDEEGELVYGPRSDVLAEYAIRAFYKYWWPTPLGSKERSRITNQIKQGPLVAAAIIIVDAVDEYKKTPKYNQEEGYSTMTGYTKTQYGKRARKPVSGSDKCSHIWPLVTPTIGGSTAFIYHANGVAQFRSGVIVPFFDWVDNKNYNKFDRRTFNDKVTEIAEQHLFGTVGNLAPANAVPIWPAAYLRTKK